MVSARGKGHSLLEEKRVPGKGGATLKLHLAPEEHESCEVNSRSLKWAWGKENGCKEKKKKKRATERPALTGVLLSVDFVVGRGTNAIVTLWAGDNPGFIPSHLKLKGTTIGKTRHSTVAGSARYTMVNAHRQVQKKKKWRRENTAATRETDRASEFELCTTRASIRGGTRGINNKERSEVQETTH